MNVPQPLIVVTAWGTRGIGPLGALLLAVSLAFLCYWRLLHRRTPPPLRWTLLTSAAGLVVAWLAPVLFSSDVYAYAAYGEMSRIGLNPYAPVPAGTNDPILRAAQLQWGGSAFPICVYGPAFVALAAGIVTLFARLGALAQLDVFRAMASAALLLCGALAYPAYRGDSQNRRRAAAMLALNPIAIWCAAEGHNDAIALLVALLGFRVLQRHPNLAGALVGLSALVKLPGIAAAGALAIAQRRALPAAMSALVLTLVLSIALFAGIMLRIAPHGTYAPQASLQAIVAPVSPLFAVAAAIAVSALLARRGIVMLRTANVEGWIWLALAAWMLVPNPYPWYGIWLVATAALAPRSPAANVAILLSLTAMLRYLPDAIAMPPPAVGAIVGMIATLPLLGLVRTRSARAGVVPAIMSDSYDG